MHDEGLIIRNATREDLPMLVQLLVELFAIESDFEFDAEKQLRGLSMMVDMLPVRLLVAAEIAGQVVGMCSAQQVVSTAEGGISVWVEDVVVLPDFRRQGIARKLLNRVEEWADGNGISRLQLLLDKENKTAELFYSRSGWRRTQLKALRKYI